MGRANSAILPRRAGLRAARQSTRAVKTARLGPARPANPMPATIAPMLAVSSDLPSDPQHYTFEYKWDGVRAICYHDGTANGTANGFRLESRNQLDITRRYPELH